MTISTPSKREGERGRMGERERERGTNDKKQKRKDLYTKAIITNKSV